MTVIATGIPSLAVSAPASFEPPSPVRPVPPVPPGWSDTESASSSSCIAQLTQVKSELKPVIGDAAIVSIRARVLTLQSMLTMAQVLACWTCVVWCVSFI